MRVIASFISLGLLTGCASYTPGTLVPPAPRCMIPPAKLPNLTQGDNLVEKHASLRRDYASVASRTKCLQRYVRAATQ